MSTFDPSDLFEKKGDELTFKATLIAGPDINLFRVAALEDTDELSDAVWGAYNWKALLDQCSSVVLIEEEEVDSAGPMTDVYYTYRVDDPKLFSSEIRRCMLSALKGRKK